MLIKSRCLDFFLSMDNSLEEYKDVLEIKEKISQILGWLPKNLCDNKTLASTNSLELEKKRSPHPSVPLALLLRG